MIFLFLIACCTWKDLDQFSCSYIGTGEDLKTGVGAQSVIMPPPPTPPALSRGCNILKPDSVFQAIELPAGIAHLDPRLA